MNDEIINAFVSYFRGRGDAYGNAKGFCVKESLTRGVFANHLASHHQGDHVGVYCMIGEQCSWGAIDIDGKDFAIKDEYDCDVWDWDRMWELSTDLATVLRVADIPTHIERTKNGYHVWVFPTEPLVPAAFMRRALMAACVALEYDPKEVNPKAEGPRVGTKGFGNFVRLPYGGALASNWTPQQRYMVDADQQPIFLLDWLADPPERADTAALEALSGLWTPPVNETSINVEHVELSDEILNALDGLSFILWRDGPLEGSDRSSTLARLAYKLKDNDTPPSDAMAVLRSADVRWGGKFAARSDGEFQLQRMLDRAYSTQG